MNGPLVYYVTAHGYGHAVRTCDILRALGEMAPRISCEIVSGLPRAWFSSRRIGLPVSIRDAVCDAGFVQLDPLRGDIEASLAQALRVWACRKDWVRREAEHLRAIRAGAVVCDIPSIPLEAAAAAGCPALAVGNFSWDWIYRHFSQADPRWRPVVDMFTAGYSAADLLLRLPFHEPMTSFRRRKDLPLVARPGRNRREEIATEIGAPLEARWVLMALARMDWAPEATARMNAVEGTVFLSPAPSGGSAPGMIPVDSHRFLFSDLLASCDVVVSKPGFGILSECVVNDKPLVYAMRDDFPEMNVLAPAIRTYVRGAPVSLDSFYAGDLGAALDSAQTAPPPRERMPAGGDRIAARYISEYIRGAVL